MNRTLVSSLVALTSVLAGCPESMSPDAGTDAPIVMSDAGVDAPVALPDAGVDAPIAMIVDTGVDAPARDGSILPPRDTGDPFGDTGTAGTPEWVPLDVLVDGSSCPAFTACGGDEVGTWDVTGGCVEFPAPMGLDLCPGATFDAIGRGRGRVTFTGTNADRVAQSEVTVTAFVPSVCAGFLGGCDALATQIQAQLPDATCVTTSLGCDCEGRLLTEILAMDAYTIEGNEIVSSSSAKRWEYCVMDGALRYRDVSADTASREPGIIELGMP